MFLTSAVPPRGAQHCSFHRSVCIVGTCHMQNGKISREPRRWIFRFEVREIYGASCSLVPIVLNLDESPTVRSSFAHEARGDLERLYASLSWRFCCLRHFSVHYEGMYTECVKRTISPRLGIRPLTHQDRLFRATRRLTSAVSTRSTKTRCHTAFQSEPMSHAMIGISAPTYAQDDPVLTT